MQVRQVAKRRWLLVLDRGEELVGTVTGFLEEKGVLGGHVSGLGALRNTTVGYFDVEKQEYVKRTFEESMELGNLVGTVGSADGKPLLHAHVTLSGPELIAFAGHLVKGEVSVTAELLVTNFEQDLPREEDEDIGLKLFALEPREKGGEAAE